MITLKHPTHLGHTHDTAIWSLYVDHTTTHSGSRASHPGLDPGILVAPRCCPIPCPHSLTLFGFHLFPHVPYFPIPPLPLPRFRSPRRPLCGAPQSGINRTLANSGINKSCVGPASYHDIFVCVTCVLTHLLYNHPSKHKTFV